MICPATGKECLVDCDGHCYISRVAPVLAQDIRTDIKVKSATYTQLNNIDTETAIELGKQIGEAAVKIINQK